MRIRTAVCRINRSPLAKWTEIGWASALSTASSAPSSDSRAMRTTSGCLSSRQAFRNSTLGVWGVVRPSDHAARALTAGAFEPASRVSMSASRPLNFSVRISIARTRSEGERLPSSAASTNFGALSSLASGSQRARDQLLSGCGADRHWASFSSLEVVGKGRGAMRAGSWLVLRIR